MATGTDWGVFRPSPQESSAGASTLPLAPSPFVPATLTLADLLEDSRHLGRGRLALRCQLNRTAKTPLPTPKAALKAAVGRPRFAPCRPPSTLFVRASGANASAKLSDFHALAVVENDASDARTFPAGQGRRKGAPRVGVKACPGTLPRIPQVVPGVLVSTPEEESDRQPPDAQTTTTSFGRGSLRPLDPARKEDRRSGRRTEVM